jgi:hypothetical protein
LFSFFASRLLAYIDPFWRIDVKAIAQYPKQGFDPVELRQVDNPSGQCRYSTQSGVPSSVFPCF